MTPQLYCCHAPFGRDLAALRDYVARHGYQGVEWGLDGWRVMVARRRREQRIALLREAVAHCSVHAPYADLEIGHRDPELAAASVRILQEYLDVAAELGARHAVLHVGTFGPDPEELCWDTLCRNLTRLLRHGARRGVPVAVENLRQGPTGDPETFAALLRTTGAPAVFDHGHALGSPWVQAGRGSVLDVLSAIPTPILAAHLYLIEREDVHLPPADPAEMREALTALRDRGCDCWVLELHAREPLERTRRVVEACLQPEADPKTA